MPRWSHCFGNCTRLTDRLTRAHVICALLSYFLWRFDTHEKRAGAPEERSRSCRNTRPLCVTKEKCVSNFWQGNFDASEAPTLTAPNPRRASVPHPVALLPTIAVCRPVHGVVAEANDPARHQRPQHSYSSVSHRFIGALRGHKRAISGRSILEAMNRLERVEQIKILL
jgi:hypothetical protein